MDDYDGSEQHQRATQWQSLVPARATSGVPNKPMVATATTWLASNSTNPLRRHIGRPLGRETQTTRRDDE